MNIAVDRIKPSIAPYRGVSFTSTHYGVSTAFQGEIKEVRGSSCIISYWCDGDLKEVQLPIDRVTVQESLTETWWRDIVGVPPLEKVLGDSADIEITPLKIDAIGRGKKGFGHGSIDMKPVRRKRKNGRIWEKYQAWYQWEDEVGKHCRYLRKGVDLTVQRLIDEGATVEMILESIGKSKSESKGKTR